MNLSKANLISTNFRKSRFTKHQPHQNQPE
ncbi:MAG: hypothetical protein AAF757_03500 [Cyanobacteria bacterium P01_D01_bin.116]